MNTPLQPNELLASNLDYLLSQRGVELAWLGGRLEIELHTLFAMLDAPDTKVDVPALLKISRFFGPTVDELLTVDLKRRNPLEQGCTPSRCGHLCHQFSAAGPCGACREKASSDIAKPGPYVIETNMRVKNWKGDE